MIPLVWIPSAWFCARADSRQTSPRLSLCSDQVSPSPTLCPSTSQTCLGIFCSYFGAGVHRGHPPSLLPSLSPSASITGGWPATMMLVGSHSMVQLMWHLKETYRERPKSMHQVAWMLQASWGTHTSPGPDPGLIWVDNKKSTCPWTFNENATRKCENLKNLQRDPNLLCIYSENLISSIPKIFCQNLVWWSILALIIWIL